VALSITLALLALLAAAGLVYLWRRNRRLKAELDDMVRLSMLNHETNYRLACFVYGQAAVDRAIENANCRSVN
jgi:hypothetical protein